MRAVRLLILLATAAVTLGLLAGCGGSSSGGTTPGTATGSASGSDSATAAGAGSGTASCSVAPASLVGSALGTSLTGPAETRNGDTVVVCDYQGTKAGLVKVRIQTDSDAASFAAEKGQFPAQKMKTTDETLGDEAFSNVLGGAYPVTTVVARKGSVEILVTGKATVAQEKALITQLFDRV